MLWEDFLSERFTFHRYKNFYTLKLQIHSRPFRLTIVRISNFCGYQTSGKPALFACIDRVSTRTSSFPCMLSGNLGYIFFSTTFGISFASVIDFVCLVVFVFAYQFFVSDRVVMRDPSIICYPFFTVETFFVYRILSLPP